jgi:hypothetical protein
LLAALLTIWRYGRLGSGIEQGRLLGSYEQWGEWVHNPLITLGCRDPVERVSEAKVRDPTRQVIATLRCLVGAGPRLPCRCKRPA